MVVDKQNRARERKVTVGVREGNRVQILGGVAEGEQVITQGALGLEDKAKVEVKSDEDDDDDDDADDNATPAPAAAGQKADAKGGK
jgi:multidrug efflux system membrane fusion protein